MWLALLAATSVAAALACHSATGPSSGTPRAALLALARVDSFNPASSVRCVVKNNTITTCDVVHSDSAGTLFARFTFTPMSIFTVNDTLACDTCSVALSLVVHPGLYSFSVTPGTVRFDASGPPTVEVHYGRYGDLSVFDSSSQYADTTAFEQALELWRERTPGSWVLASSSTHSASHVITAAIETTTNYLVAAPK